jgi:hypothetical protein
MRDLLFAVPWWIPTLLAGVGLVAFWSGNNRQQAGPRRAGIALLLLAIAWATVSYFVDTDKEKCERTTQQLVKSVVDGNWDFFQSQLNPDATFRIEAANARAEGADAITRYARAGAESIHLRSAYLQHIEARQTGPIVTIDTNIYSTEEQAAPTMNSGFEFDWEQTSKGWRVREIRLMRIGDVQGQELQRMMPGK